MYVRKLQCLVPIDISYRWYLWSELASLSTGLAGICSRGHVGTQLSFVMTMRVIGQRTTGERVSAFRRTLDLCQHRLTELKDYVTRIFQSVMAHRFRCLSGPLARLSRQLHSSVSAPRHF